MSGAPPREPASPFEPVRFAVVGCGMLARAQHLPNIAHSPKTVLRTCCDVSDDALDNCRRLYNPERTTRDYAEAIADDDVEAVCLATTETLRRPVIECAARAGKAVYVEKPVAGTLAETLAIRDIVTQSGIPFCVGHNRRCSPAMVDARRIWREHMARPVDCPWRFDRVGRRKASMSYADTGSMLARINDDFATWKEWVFDDALSERGPMVFEMTHFTDLCNWFLGAEPEAVMAMESGWMHEGVVIRYRTGEMATVTMTGAGTFGYPKELYELYGKAGAVIVDHMLEVRTAGIAAASPRATYPMLNDRHPDVGAEGGVPGWLAKKREACREAEEKNDPRSIFTAEPDKGHARMMDAFAEEIRGLRPEPVCPVGDAVRATVLAFAARRAAKERRMVNVGELDGTG